MESASDPVDQYIFRESEFEEPSFDSASFVSKYRRVTSLESLRQQLRDCADGLKNQLYLIINNDYKDFINIATKLDGVDTRIEFLRKPLVDLRLDLAALHDGLLASVQLIQDKLRRKAEVSDRKLLLETILSCADKLDIVEGMVGESRDSIATDTDSKRSSRRRLSSLIGDDESKKQLFHCSELERAAFAIAQAEELLEKINTKVSTENLTSNRSFISQLSARNKELESIHRTLQQRSNQLSTALADEINQQVVAMLTKQLSYGVSAIGTSEFPSAAFRHCVRALLVINRVDAVESAVERNVVSPMCRSILTQGRVDGSGGRGSYFGLHECFKELFESLKMVLSETVRITEEQIAAYPGTTNLDLIIHSVWRPFSSVLIERFPSMFTIAIADSFSRCFLAFDSFKVLLSSIAGDEWRTGISNRLKISTIVAEIDGKWQLEVYFHLRKQEICSVIDRACDASLVQGITKNVLELPSGAAQSFVDTVDEELHFELFQLSIVKLFSMSAGYCLSNRVLLRPLRGRFLSLALQIIHRLEAHVCITSDLSTTRFTRQALQSMQSNPTSNTQAVANDNSRTQSPIKKPATAVIPSTPQGPSTVSAASTPSTPAGQSKTPTPITVEELVLLFMDLRLFQKWLGDSFAVYAVKRFDFDQGSGDLVDADGILKSFSLSLDDAVLGVWTKTVNSVVADCKRNLGGVRVIAGKYRMTNKPPPDTPSPYVETVLQPLRSFVDKHGDRVITMLSEPHNEWIKSSIDDITGHFCQQVQSLIETVKQMDTALQRRSKVRGPSGGQGAGTMSDSEKIALQVSLDVSAFGTEISGILAMDPTALSSYANLLSVVEDAKSAVRDIAA